MCVYVCVTVLYPKHMCVFSLFFIWWESLWVIYLCSSKKMKKKKGWGPRGMLAKDCNYKAIMYPLKSILSQWKVPGDSFINLVFGTCFFEF